MKRILLLLCLVYSITANAQRSIELLGADVSEYDQSMVDAERLIGNVRFKQDNVYMDCDSAWFYHEDNKIEAFGHIFIRQQDTLNLWGDYLLYNGDTKQALVKNNVRLTDRQMTLTTDLLNYDMNNKVAWYTTGGNITNANDHLYSRIGYYYSRNKDFHFNKNVKLTNPEYVMDSDTLRYNTDRKVAFFHGPTHIRSEENTIHCHYGWYDTDLNTSEFSKGASIEGAENKLWADSMVYNRNTGVGRAFRNIVLHDSVEEVRIAGEYGKYKRFEKTTWISGNPIAMKFLDDDTLFMKADTLVDKTDTTTGQREMIAYHKTVMYKSDMQSVADSMIYNFTDSTITLFYDPVIWNEVNQVTGDTLIIFRRNNKLDRMEVKKKAFIVLQEDSIKYNQVKGQNMTAWFANNKINHIRVYGNGQSIYYAKEDSVNYTGVNEIVCSDMLIVADSGKIKHITFYTQPEGTFYPLEQFPEDNLYLPDFKWRDAQRPKQEQFLKEMKRLVPKGD